MLKFKNIISMTILVSTILGGSTVLAKDSRIYENNINGGNGYKNFSQMAEISWDIRYANDKSLSGQAFNCEIYEDLGIKVYGEPTDIKDNIFQEKKDGYFKKDGKYGEWKYLGVDDFGQPFLNPFFIDVDLENATPLHDSEYEMFRKNYAYMRYGSQFVENWFNNEGVRNDRRRFLNELKTPEGIKMKDFLMGDDPLKYAVIVADGEGQQIAYVWVLENIYGSKPCVKTLVFSSHEKINFHSEIF